MNFKKKRRILFSGEASWSETGYGRIYSNLLKRVFQSGKYDIAEFSAFAQAGDPRDINVKWRLYCNNPSNPAEFQAFNANESNKLGAYRLDKTLLDFRPDIIFDARDSVMSQHLMLTPLRKFFYLILAPSIDSSPQIDEWIGHMLGADSCLGYTHYAKQVMEDEGAGKIKFYKTMYPGISPEEFYPIKNKNQLRQKYGLNPDLNIFISTGRNQIRKLKIELLKAFRIYLDKVKDIDINLYNNTICYVHTTNPDLRTWSIGKALVEFNLANKVLFSYYCTKCNKYFPNKYQDTSTTCILCGGEAIMPRIDRQVPIQNLNEIYNLCDLTVHLASASALEMPVIESAAAGCNIIGVDFAGVGDAIKRLEGTLIRILGAPRDINVDANRCFPDNEHLADELIKFFRRPRQINLRNGLKTSEKAYQRFSWDKAASILMELFDNCELTGHQGKWASNINWSPNTNIPDNIPVCQWVYTFLDNVLQESHLKHSYFIDDMIKYAELKVRSTGNGVIEWNINNVKQMLQNMFNNKMAVENIRTGKARLGLEDWINYSELKALTNLE